MTDVYMKCNNGIKWVNATIYIIHLSGTIIYTLEIIPHRFLASPLGGSNLKLVVLRARVAVIFVKIKINNNNDFIFTQERKINSSVKIL